MPRVLNRFDKLCAILAFALGALFLVQGLFGVFWEVNADYSLSPGLGVLPAFVGWGIVRSIRVAWKASGDGARVAGGGSVAPAEADPQSVGATAARGRPEEGAPQLLKTSLAEMRTRMPGKRSEDWPEGEPYAVGFEHGTMTLGLYAPVGRDPQRPHDRDEVYLVHAGTSDFVLEGQRIRLEPGDAVFVRAGASHRFEDMGPGFATWVVFWGPDPG